jgi:hypothetical protein
MNAGIANPRRTPLREEQIWRFDFSVNGKSSLSP